MKWLIKNSALAENQTELKKILLENRQVVDEQQWFNPPKPTTFKIEELNIDQAALKKSLEILNKVKNTQGLIVIFGDYDADGITATAILWRVLHNLGFNAKPFIPDRLNHGYGLTTKALDEIFTTATPELLITVDNGIVAHEAVDYLNKKNCPIILTDHHLPEEELPKADAIFHSTKVCGAGVSWLFAREIIRHFSADNDQLISKQLDLAGIATIADQMPLTQFNRSFAAWGIKSLKNTTRLGLTELIKNSSINQSLIDSNIINYAIAPRINAMGRLKNGLQALRLLCTTNQEQAANLAQELSNTNVERQDLTAQQIESAMEQVEAQAQEKLLIVQEHSFHEGVIGLIAGKLTEQFNKPVIVISLNETTGKASARSIAGINIIELIREVKSDLLAAGGHPMAAGFSVEISKIDLIKKKLQALAQKYDDELFERKLEVECLLPVKLATDKTHHLLKTFEPFGVKNPTPIFGFDQLKIISIKTMGQESQHLRLAVSDEDGQYLNIIGWKKGYLAETLTSGQLIKVAGELSLNEWRGRTTTQITARSIEAVI
ncbi:single-stranded-DNA-specific exonuclease RecJ [Patescibacteria group bacterium]|nr:single-stranded-DNA-specific exonuclease RecJ [Patescibacteria group bacterium]